MRKSFAWWLMVALAATIGALALAACGGGSSSSSSAEEAEGPTTPAKSEEGPESGGGGATSSANYTPSSPGEMPQLGGEKQKEAEAAAVAAAKTEGGKTQAPEEGLTIGFLESIGANELTKMSLESLEEAAGHFGWKVVAADGEGDPAKIGAAMTTLLNEHVDAIVGFNPTAPLIQQQLKETEERGIPYISIGSEAEGIPDQYVFENEVAWGMMAELMQKEFPPSPEVAFLYAPLLTSLKRSTEETIEFGKEHGWKILGPTQLDLASLEQGAQAAANSALTSNPNMTAFYVDNSVSAPAVAAILKQRGKCGEVKEYSALAAAANMALVREGCITALTNPPFASGVWAAVDQIAEYLARHGSLSKIPPDNEALNKLYGIDLFEPQIVSSANVPPDGSYQQPIVDSTSFFLKKWELEFGS